VIFEQVFTPWFVFACPQFISGSPTTPLKT
jgi:hypothetical protein